MSVIINGLEYEKSQNPKLKCRDVAKVTLPGFYENVQGTVLRYHKVGEESEIVYTLDICGDSQTFPERVLELVHRNPNIGVYKKGARSEKTTNSTSSRSKRMRSTSPKSRRRSN